MVNVLSPICIEPNCEKKSAYNVEGQTARLYCGDHKKEGMVQINGAICQYEGCKTTANFNFEGKKRGKFCVKHKEPKMVDVKNKICIESTCPKKASFNYENMKPALYCNNHKKDGMINIFGRICEYEDCKTRPYFNIEGETPGRFCTKHKQSGMVDVINKRCIVPMCPTLANKNYENHCTRCFIHLFPDKPTARNYKTKERSVVEFIKAEFPDYEFNFDKSIQDGCSRRRPDILLDMGDQVIIVEIDENQHQVYDCSCENKRIMEISQDLQHRPLVFIRFNPDEYLDASGKKIQSCWKAADGVCSVKLNKETEWKQRLASLKDSLKYWIANKTDKTVEIVQLYYDMNT